MRATFDHSHSEASNILTFYFKPEKPIHYTSGQFIELTIDHDEPDDRCKRRWFTLSSSPSEPMLSITTKFSDRSSSFKTALRALKPGADVIISEAMGDFVLPKSLSTPVIMVAGGIGITPFRSMFKSLSATKEVRPIKFVYAVKNEDEIVFQDEMREAGVHATIVVSQPSDAWGGERGQIDAELIIGLEQPSDDTLVYISGPEPMVDSLSKQLKSDGLKHHQLVTDDFPNYTAI